MPNIKRFYREDTLLLRQAKYPFNIERRSTNCSGQPPEVTFRKTSDVFFILLNMEYMLIDGNKIFLKI